MAEKISTFYQSLVDIFADEGEVNFPASTAGGESFAKIPQRSPGIFLVSPIGSILIHL
jgi:hypothetical protein